MTKRHSTKQSLIASILVLCLCFTSLIGTTFAWFTDSVTSDGNVIKTGTLDVELYYADGKQDPASAIWNDASKGALYTDDQLWEPGYTDAKHIKIANEGSLALKYQLAIIPNGEVSKLADVIDVYLYEIADTDANATQVKNRTDLDETMRVGTLADVISKGIVQGSLEAGDDYTTTIVLKMRETADNDYQGLSIGSNFSIQLLATQYTSESDSFGDDYDADAWMPGMLVYNEADLRAALANGGTYKLIGNFDSKGLEIAENGTVKLDVTGNTITVDDSEAYGIANLGDLTIAGAGTVSMTHWGSYNVGKLTLTNGATLICDSSIETSAIWNRDGGELIVDGATIESKAPNYAVYCGVNQNGQYSGGKATFNNATVNATFGALRGAGTGEIIVNSGTYTSASTSGHTVYTYTESRITINGGTFTNTAEGGNVIYVDGKSTVVINGGTFNGKLVASNDATLEITGGTFDEDPSAYVADGFTAVQNGDHYYVVADGIDKIILSADDLLALSGKYVVGNNGTAETITYALMADIDLGGAEFKELGVAYGDTVNFLGNGHTISNFKLATGKHNGMTNVGMFYVDSGATLNVSDLTLNDVTVADGVDAYTIGAAVVVGYANGAVNLTDVDVNRAKVNNTYGNAAIYVGYGVNAINLTDCDITDAIVSGEFENGAVRTDKTGAYVGTANTTSCVVTVTNCTNGTSYNDFGRVIDGATAKVDDYIPVSNGLYTDGEGKYIVKTAAGMSALNGIISKNVKSVELLASIDMSGTPWEMVDMHADANGKLETFNGNGYTISNLVIDGEAMFSRMASSADTVTFSNVVFENVTVSSEESNTAIITKQVYGNLVLDNVDVNGASIKGETKVATLVGTVYNEKDSTVTLTVKNCDVSNVEITGNPDDTSEERLAGLVAWVADKYSNEAIVLENNTMTNVAITSNSTASEHHALIYISDKNTGANNRYGVYHNEDAGVTLTDCTYTRKVADGLYTDLEGDFYVYNANGLIAMHDTIDPEWGTDYLSGKTINIMSNIDAAGKVWNTINMQTGSSNKNGFTFNGNGYTISNLQIVGSTTMGTGMFAVNCGTANPSVFKDLTFDNVTVNGGWHTGIIWGQAYGNIVIENVHVINSNVTGTCNVGALIGRNGDDRASNVTFKDCSVTNTKVTSTGGGDNCGASAFIGMALKTPGASVNLVFEGENVAEGNTLTSAAGHQGGGIYAKATLGEATWDTPVVVTVFESYNCQ